MNDSDEDNTTDLVILPSDRADDEVVDDEEVDDDRDKLSPNALPIAMSGSIEIVSNRNKLTKYVKQRRFLLDIMKITAKLKKASLLAK